MFPIKDDVTARVHGYWTKIQKVGFWWLIIFIFGMAMGFKSADLMYSSKFDDAIKLGGVIHKNVVYDLKLRP